MFDHVTHDAEWLVMRHRVTRVTVEDMMARRLPCGDVQARQEFFGHRRNFWRLFPRGAESSNKRLHVAPAIVGLR